MRRTLAPAGPRTRRTDGGKGDLRAPVLGSATAGPRLGSGSLDRITHGHYDVLRQTSRSVITLIFVLHDEHGARTCSAKQIRRGRCRRYRDKLRRAVPSHAPRTGKRRKKPSDFKGLLYLWRGGQSLRGAKPLADKNILNAEENDQDAGWLHKTFQRRGGLRQGLRHARGSANARGDGLLSCVGPPTATNRGHALPGKSTCQRRDSSFHAALLGGAGPPASNQAVLRGHLSGDISQSPAQGGRWRSQAPRARQSATSMQISHFVF